MFFLLFLFTTALSNNYLVPSYFGYLNKNFFLQQNLTTNKLKLLEMEGSVDYVNESLVFYARSNNHVLMVGNQTAKTYKILVGRLDETGIQVGRVQNTLLKSPSAVVYFKECRETAQYEDTTKIVLTRDSNCSISSEDCLLKNFGNITFENIRFVPTIQKKPCSNVSEYVILSDTGNHCIKKIHLKTKLVTVVAGRCGESGFKDGPLAFSRLNSPKEIGVTATGQIIFHDSANEYMRMVKDGSVYSLANGACRLYDQKQSGGGTVVRRVACYVDWIQSNIIKSQQSHWFKPAETVGICKQHYSICVKQ